MTLRLVVFDVDGTLVDSQSAIIGAMRAAFAACDLPAPMDSDTLSIVGLSLDIAIARLRPDLPAPIIARLVAAYKDSFSTNRQLSTMPLYPGALDVVTQLHEQEATLLGIATGKSRRGLDHLMTLHDMQRFFVTTQVADNHPSKPHPSMLHATLRETGADGGIMIGDTTYDMDMARAAGFTAIGVSWGYHRAEHLHAAGAHVVIDAFDALPGALARLWEVPA
ncbi:HAD-IA family hydrolase [Roseicitreum antarcticum]|uniref:Phosphoglycolate phosphatase n=1 Tax=Roseicitreum antarcticum TaxID=564137 RepID=A0A1H3AQV0_9RHOB|nr:HAD-IA family hydrolase [Roseicitreum antarcticum]SDX32047.1 phosphoglycolate phosphatase [Roseicitreum antarcticum]